MNPTLKKEIEKDDFWLCEGPCKFNIVFIPARAFVTAYKYTGRGWKDVFIYHKGGEYLYQNLRTSETIDNAKWLLEGELEKRHKGWNIKKKEFEKSRKEYDKTDLSKLSNRQLADFYKKQDRLILGLWNPVIAMEGAGLYIDTVFSKKLQEEYDITQTEATHIINIIGKSPKKSFVAEEYESFLNLCVLYKKKDKNFEKELEKHQKKYFWIENNYKDVKVISKEEFRKRIKDYEKDARKELNDMQKHEDPKELMQKYRLKKEDVDIIKKFGIITMLLDERKKMNLQTNHILSLTLKEIAKRASMTYSEINWLTPEEIIHVLDGKKFTKKQLNERKYIFMWGDKRKQEWKLYFGKEAKEYIRLLENARNRDISHELKGMPTWKFGKVTGKVQVVLDAKKDKFDVGNILVTSMTRPEFVPLMKKAKAIITNEGGITCHAAIISRELKIPCIIGTKNATKVLKNGDDVEIDAEKGVVRKI